MLMLLLVPSTDDAKPAIRGKHLRIIVGRPVYSRTTGTQEHPYGEVERVQQYTLDLNLLCFFILKLNTLDAHPELPPPPRGTAAAVILSLLCCSRFSYYFLPLPFCNRSREFVVFFILQRLFLQPRGLPIQRLDLPSADPRALIARLV